MRNEELYARVKDYIIIASHLDGKMTEINLIKDLLSEIEKLEGIPDKAIMDFDLAIKSDLPNSWEHVRDHGRHATFCNALNDIRNEVRKKYQS